MEDSTYKWSKLLMKYLKNEISKEELTELHRQMDASSQKRKQFEKVTAPDYYKKRLMQYQNIDIKKNYKRLIKEYPHLRPSRLVRISQNKMVRYAAAVCVIIAVATYFIVKNNSPSRSSGIAITILPEPAVKPYSYVALSTGQEFKLKELANGVLFSANGATIRIKDSLVIIDTSRISQLHNETVFALVTAPKSQERLKLPDGSVFTLDAASYIVFKLYNLGRKRVVKIYGQAYCEVNPTKKPFAVQLNDSVNVVVTGTKFNVRNYKNENPKIALISGKIMLTRGEQTYKMAEGQTVGLNKEKKFELIKDADAGDEIAWTQKIFKFDDKNVYQMMDEVGAFYNYPVLFTSDSMPGATSEGSIPFFPNPDNTARAVSIQYDVHVEIRNDSFIVSKLEIK
jgi:hypothetical protein